MSGVTSWDTETCAEADRAGELGDEPLVRRIAIAVHEDDSDRRAAARLDALELGAHARRIGRTLDLAAGQHALVDLDDLGIELLGLDDCLGEDVRPRLVADPQRIAETLRRDEERRLALALEQRVGGDRRAHADLADGAGRHGIARSQAEQVADALHGRVAIGFRILRQQLADMQAAARIAPDDVREGAAAVDPEMPLIHARSPSA